nr:MAG TPA: hypothetical protein [Caudoviricetes sp.]
MNAFSYDFYSFFCSFSYLICSLFDSIYSRLDIIFHLRYKTSLISECVYLLPSIF